MVETDPFLGALRSRSARVLEHPSGAVVEPTAMTTNEPNGNERIDSRTERALTQYLTVLADVGRAKGADDLFLVVSQSGTEYLVDRREGRCTCPDHEHRGVRCKHLRRVAFATGARPVPDGVDGVDSQLGMHVDGATSSSPT